MEVTSVCGDQFCPVQALSDERPIVIRGGALAWRATSGWSIETLGQRFPNARIPVRFDEGVWWWTVGALSRAILNGERVYGIDWDYEADCPELRSELGEVALSQQDCFDSLPIEERPRFRWLYIGAAGTGSPLHQDLLATHAWLAVCEGRKRWVLYPPETEFTSVDKAGSPFGDKAEALDLQMGRQRFETTVARGDIIFVPSLWWHAVRNLTRSISVTRNFCVPKIRARVCAQAVQGSHQKLAASLGALT